MMIGIIALMIANRSIYLHTHMLPTGILVTHSHPYDKSTDSGPYKTHHHTNAEFLFLENLDILFLSVFVALIAGVIYTVAEYSCKAYSFFSFLYFHANQGRAPPIP